MNCMQRLMGFVCQRCNSYACRFGSTGSPPGTFHHCAADYFYRWLRYKFSNCTKRGSTHCRYTYIFPINLGLTTSCYLNPLDS